MTQTLPASVMSDGMVLVLWVPELGDPDQPGLSELTAPSVLDLSCYLTDQGWDPQITEASAADPRLCSTEDFAQPGRKATQIPLIYVTNPDDPTNDEAATTLVERSTGFLVERRGVDVETALAVGDLVTVYPAKLGVQVEAKPTANTPLTINQMAYLQPPGRQFRVAVASS